MFPALVQGVGAKESIVTQLNKAQEFDLDVIICGRGGGSIEDLWAFNEEIVARAIFASKIPIISAVGHEVDFTIADFVADLRAPTPTGAAEMAVPNMADLNNLLNQYRIRSNESINNLLKINKRKIEELKNSFIIRNPMSLYEIKEQRLDMLIDSLHKIINVKLTEYNVRLNNVKSSYILKNPLGIYDVKKELLAKYKDSLKKIIISLISDNSHKYQILVNKLELLNPLNILSKGYSLVTLDKEVIKVSKLFK